MTDEIKFYLEVIKTFASIANPITITIIGVLFLKRVENIKATIAKTSEFHKKWGEQFFECCQQFMQCIERYFSILTIICGMKKEDQEGEYGMELNKELHKLFLTIMELELRIKRNLDLAPLNGDAAKNSASECLKLIGEFNAKKGGNVDVIIEKINEFNIVSNKAHAEILNLKDTSKNLATR